MVYNIVVGPPKNKGSVYTGTLWHIEKTQKTLLVMGKITADVFSVAFWDVDGELGDKSTQVSMLADDVLLSAAELIAEPLPQLITMIMEAQDNAPPVAIS